MGFLCYIHEHPYVFDINVATVPTIGAPPMIKRSTNRTPGANPRRLPSGNARGKTAPAPAHGEFYAATVPQAESAGFRRTHKWTGM